MNRRLDTYDKMSCDSSPSKSSDQWNEASKKDDDSDSATDEVLPPRTYEPKQTTKFIRVLIVLAYVLSVSMAAIMLSLYYVFLWDPSPTYEQESSAPMALREDFDAYTMNNSDSLLKDETILTNAQVTSSSLKTPLQFPADVFYDDGSLPLDDGDGNFKPTDFFDGNETSFEQPVLLPLNQQRENIFLQRIKDSVKR